MIPSRRSAAGFHLLRFLVIRSLKRRFSGVYISGLQHLQNIPLTQPVIVCASHHNWWDGFLAVYLGGFIRGRKLFLAQEEKHLARYSFFRHAGAFGIGLETPRASLPGLRHALALLKNPTCLLWIYPEGRLTSPDAPYEIRGGAGLLAEKSSAVLLPAFVRMAWREESWPAVLISLGPVVEADVLAPALENLRASSEDFADPLKPLTAQLHLRGRMSLNRKWDIATQQDSPR